ncbi:MAG: phosphoribosyltransferase family protein [Cyanobacteriota bacterium]
MSSAPIFRDRITAGEQLAQPILAEIKQLQAQGLGVQPIVYALPRGGIPVAVPVARCLGCPVDIVVAKKITRPENPELAIGAVTSDGHVIWYQPKRSRKDPENNQLREAALHQAQEKAAALYSQLSPSCLSVSPRGAIAILIDDGIATGMTMAAAAYALKAQEPAAVWVCSPVAPIGLSDWLLSWSDRVIILQTPDPFLSVSRFYEEFPQVETEEALADLQQHNQQISPGTSPPDAPLSR